jgi:hypothetical protein
MIRIKLFPILRCLECNEYPELVHQEMIHEHSLTGSGTYTYYEAGLMCPCGQAADGMDSKSLQTAISEAFMNWTLMNIPGN